MKLDLDFDDETIDCLKRQVEAEGFADETAYAAEVIRRWLDKPEGESWAKSMERMRLLSADAEAAHRASQASRSRR